MCQASQSKAIILVPKAVLIIQIEQALLALAALSFTSITLQHSVFQCHGRIALTETAVLESTAVVAQVVFLQECLSALSSALSIPIYYLLNTSLSTSSRASCHSLEVASANIMLDFCLALIKLIELGSDLVELRCLLSTVDVLCPSLFAALFGFLRIRLPV